MSLQSEFAEIAAMDGRAALVTVIAGPGLGAKLLVRADGSTEGGLGTPERDSVGVEAAEELLWAERSETREAGEATLFVDVVAPAPRLIVFGAVDYATALCRLARAAGWRSFVCDPRSQFATRERFPDAEEVIAAWPDEAFARLGGIDRATYIAVSLTIRSSTTPRSRSRCAPTPPTWERWAAAAPRHTDASACSRPGWTRSCSTASPRRSASTSVP